MCDRADLLRVTPADGGARLLLTLESEDGGKETLTLLTARLTALPRTGKISAEALDFYRREAAVTEAVSIGMRLLAFGGNSAKALRQKLRQRSVPADAADAAVAVLTGLGYLREQEGAIREAERGMAKLWGDRRILLELRAKGYGDEALSAVAQALREEDFVPICVDTVRRKSPRPPADPVERKKLIAYLLRCGFEASEVREALTEAWECTN